MKMPLKKKEYLNIPSEVVIVQCWSISIGVLFKTHVEVILIKVDSRILVAIRSTNKSHGRSLVVKAWRALQIFTVVFTPSAVCCSLESIYRQMK